VFDDLEKGGEGTRPDSGLDPDRVRPVSSVVLAWPRVLTGLWWRHVTRCRRDTIPRSGRGDMARRVKSREDQT
jgi:hypothetical protein